MIPITIAVILAVLWDIAHCQCNLGDVRVVENIKMKCDPTGEVPIACLPTGKLDGMEISPGETYTQAAFKWQCVQEDQWRLSFVVVACLLPNGTEFSVGSSVIYPSKGNYSCVANSNKTVSRLLRHGCYYAGRLFSPNDQWNQGQTKVTCTQGPDGYDTPTAIGCLLDAVTVPVNNYIEYPVGSYFKCQPNPTVSDQATLIPVTVEQYNAWKASQSDESAQETEGTGQPTPQSGGGEKRMLTVPAQPSASPSSSIIVGQCEDTHPICQQICSNLCGPAGTPQTGVNMGPLTRFLARISPSAFNDAKMRSIKWREFIDRILGRPSGQRLAGDAQMGPASGPWAGGWSGDGWRPDDDDDCSSESDQFDHHPWHHHRSLQCARVTDQANDLIKIFCPKSCGGCTANAGTNFYTTAAQNWNLAYCASDNGMSQPFNPNGIPAGKRKKREIMRV